MSRFRLRPCRTAPCWHSCSCSRAASSRLRTPTSPRAERGVVQSATAHDFWLPSPGSAGIGSDQPAEAPMQPQIYGGRSYAPQRIVSGGAQRTADGVQLNFDRAEIREVARVILGDILGRSYTVDSDVQGEVTLSSARPCRRATSWPCSRPCCAPTAPRWSRPAPTPTGSCPSTPHRPAEVMPLGGRPVQVRPGYGITIVPAAQHLGHTPPVIQPLVPRPTTSASTSAATPCCSAAPAPSARTWSRRWRTSTSTGWPTRRSASSRC